MFKSWVSGRKGAGGDVSLRPPAGATREWRGLCRRRNEVLSLFPSDNHPSPGREHLPPSPSRPAARVQHQFISGQSRTRWQAE
jgi:hypothetical protein